jgi:hypothetical protein
MPSAQPSDVATSVPGTAGVSLNGYPPGERRRTLLDAVLVDFGLPNTALDKFPKRYRCHATVSAPARRQPVVNPPSTTSVCPVM